MLPIPIIIVVCVCRAVVGTAFPTGTFTSHLVRAPSCKRNASFCVGAEEAGSAPSTDHNVEGLPSRNCALPSSLGDGPFSSGSRGGCGGCSLAVAIGGRRILDRNVDRRRVVLTSLLAALPLASQRKDAAQAAPPMAVIAEELGYFPVTNREGDTTYLPARVKRASTEQSEGLAKFLKSSGAVMYGAYWCPHCSRQKELFGREAWSFIRYVECSPKGFNSDIALCATEGIDGFPTWKFGNGKVGSGELKLDQIAKMSGYKGKFDGNAEAPLPSSGSGSCR